MDSHQLIRWYDETVRPFLATAIEEEKLQDFDRERERLKALMAVAARELAVCFLGNSGVGKSTLINAVIGGDQPVVPSGGVGPLTAQAIVVRYGSKTRLEVEYHTAGQLLRTVFGLEQMFKSELGTPSSTDDGDLHGADLLEEQDFVSTSNDSGTEEDQPVDSARSERRETYRRRAQLLVTGNQDGRRDLKYLLDSLREAAGGNRRWGTLAEEQDAQRIQGIRSALALAKRKLRYIAEAGPDGAFSTELQDHASGYLAPLIKSLEIRWDTPLLREGITLVDLPGVGVMRDVHREVTRYWIREKANALVLIVDHRGVHESVVEALRQSEFLNSLLYSADEPGDDPIVMVAVTRIDDIANERYHKDKSRRKSEYFLETVAEAKEKLIGQMRDSLESVWLADEEIPEGRRAVVRNLLSKLQIHPISAPEYVRLLANDEDDRSFLKSAEQSGIPGFASSLIALSKERRATALARLEQQTTLFQERLAMTIRLIQSQWEESNREEEEGLQRLREDLNVFMEPLRKEFYVRQGAFRSFLKEMIPRRIEDLIDTASVQASIQIDRYLRKLGSQHWSTLRACVRRGGRYSGVSEIDLPSEFALRFEEPTAAVWSKHILSDIRRETRDYAHDYVRIVDEVAQWALSQGARSQNRVVEAQRDAIRADAKKLESVGREMVKELRDEARAQLVNSIEAPIKEHCEAFIRKNLHVGVGVKGRILDLYHEMATSVADAAREPAIRVLQKLFREVEREILEAFKDHGDPLEAMAESVVTSQAAFIRRSDAQKRRRILERLDHVIASCPIDMSTTAVGGDV